MKIMMTLLDYGLRAQYEEVINKLKAKKADIDMCPLEDAKLGKQFRYAQNNGYTHAITQDGDTIIIKELTSGKDAINTIESLAVWYEMNK